MVFALRASFIAFFLLKLNRSPLSRPAITSPDFSRIIGENVLKFALVFPLLPDARHHYEQMLS